MSKSCTYSYTREGIWNQYQIPEIEALSGAYSDIEWEKALSEAGFDSVSHFGGEYSLFSASIYEHDVHGYVVELRAEYGRDLAWIVCKDVIAFMGFMKEFSSLFATAMTRDLMELIAAAQNSLFDEQLGLPAVRRVYQRDARMKAELRRKAEERKSASSTA